MKTKCLSDETFIKYITGRLSPQKAREVEAHLRECHDCYHSLQITHELMRTPDPEAFKPVSKKEAREILASIGVAKPPGMFESLINMIVMIIKCFQKTCRETSKRIRKVFYMIRDMTLDTIMRIGTIIFGPSPETEFAFARVRTKGKIGIRNESAPGSQQFASMMIEDINIYCMSEKVKENLFSLDIQIKESLDDDLFRIVLKDEEGGLSSKPLVNQSVFFNTLSSGSYELIIHKNHRALESKRFILNEKGQIHEKQDADS
jgi:hypothetical protein